MEKPKTQLNIALIYGSMLGLVGIIVSLVFYVMGMEFSRIPQYIGWVAMITFIVLGIKNYKEKELNGFISYGKSLGTGTLIALVAGIILSVYTIIFMKFIDPEFINKSMEQGQQAMLDKGMSEETVEKSMQMQQKFMTPAWIFVFGALGYTVMGLLFSLVISIFLKKNEEPFEA